MWSRVGSGSATVVSPSPAKRPASRIADFTCALATGSSYVSGRTGPPSIVSGAVPSVVSIRTPIRLSGSAMRSIGRERRESSPVSTNRPCWPASRPGSRRISVPALPQSIGVSGAFSPRSPAPNTRSVSGPDS